MRRPDLHSLIRWRGGSLNYNGRTWTGPGPGRDLADRSLSLELLGLGDDYAIASTAGDDLGLCEAWLGLGPRGAVAVNPDLIVPEGLDERILRPWREAGPISSVGGRWLRRLGVKPSQVPELREAPSTVSGAEALLLVPLADAGGRLGALQRIYIDKRGMVATVPAAVSTVGVARGMAFRIGAPAGVLAIASAPQVGLRALAVSRLGAVWSAACPQTLRTLPIPEFVTTVRVFVNDNPHERGAANCFAWPARSRGLSVTIAVLNGGRFRGG